MTDAVDLEERAIALASLAVDEDLRRRTLDLSIRCMDLTSLEDADTPATIAALCATALRPDPMDPTVPPVAAVCVHPRLAAVAVQALAGTSVAVASVAGAFPSGLGPLASRLDEIRAVVALGADEVDIVLNRSLFLDGRHAEASEELVAAREAAGTAHLKVILETGELGSYGRIRQASDLAMAAGADFIKTSTGKVATNATLPATLCMMEAVRDFHLRTGRRVGVKVAGGVRRSTQAAQYLALASRVLGPSWLTPERFRIGASSLLADLLRERAEAAKGP